MNWPVCIQPINVDFNLNGLILGELLDFFKILCSHYEVPATGNKQLKTLF